MGQAFKATLAKAMKGFSPKGQWITLRGGQHIMITPGADSTWAKGGKAKAKIKAKGPDDIPEKGYVTHEQFRKRQGKLLAPAYPPPSWKKLQLNSNRANKNLLGWGVTATGKKEPIYSAKWRAKYKKTDDDSGTSSHSKNQKWGTVAELNGLMPKLVGRVNADLESKPEAMTMRLIMLTGMRVGGEGQGRKPAYGATSLLLKHVVSVDGGRVHLKFPGKKNVLQDYTFHDPKLAFLDHLL